jgi:hypothetical protein
LKVKKKKFAFHLNNNLLSTALVKSVNNWNDLPVLKKFTATLTERLSTGYSSKMSTSAKSGSSGDPFIFAGTNTLMLYFGLLPPTVMVGMELI